MKNISDWMFKTNAELADHVENSLPGCGDPDCHVCDDHRDFMDELRRRLRVKEE